MNRRDFLDPRQAARATGHLLGALEHEGPSEVSLLRLGWRAMATGWELILPGTTPDAFALGQHAFELLDTLEGQLTVYREYSEVSSLNRQAALEPVVVEPRLHHLIRTAAAITESTEGAFDITTGALIKVWGFFRGPRRVPSMTERTWAIERVGMRHVVLEERGNSIQFLREGLEINLGSIGKGYALDRLIESMTNQANLPAVLLHGGSSSVYAKGCPHGEGRGWRVRVRHPWRAGKPLAELWLRDQALGTSAATFQFLEHEGKKLGHVLDPRTGWPAAGIASASVVAPTGALADALSTAFYVGGLELARRYCEGHPEVGALLLPDGGRAPVVFNLPPEQFLLTGRQP